MDKSYSERLIEFALKNKEDYLRKLMSYPSYISAEEDVITDFIHLLTLNYKVSLDLRLYLNNPIYDSRFEMYVDWVEFYRNGRPVSHLIRDDDDGNMPFISGLDINTQRCIVNMLMKGKFDGMPHEIYNSTYINTKNRLLDDIREILNNKYQKKEYIGDISIEDLKITRIYMTMGDDIMVCDENWKVIFAEQLSNEILYIILNIIKNIQ